MKFTDIDPMELWFGRAGNHLVISLIGSPEKVTINNWYSSGDYMVDEIEAGGSCLAETQVDLMIQAMAAVGAPGGADEQRDVLTPVLSAYWQPRV